MSPEEARVALEQACASVAVRSRLRSVCLQCGKQIQHTSNMLMALTYNTTSCWSITTRTCCTVLQDPAQHAHAMRFILDFRRSSSVISDAVHVLQNSRVLEAVFEAAVALRLACLSDWRHQVKAHEKVELRQWLVQYLVQHTSAGLSGPSLAVISTLRVAHACILKRLWLESGAGQWQASVHVWFLSLTVVLPYKCITC